MINALAEPKTQTDVRTPELEDGQHLWRLAKDTAVLDLNSSYSYLLWCRDFAETSVIARIDGEPAGFITGYTRPENPDTLMIWQVAVDEKFRGHGLASTMLHELARPHRRSPPGDDDHRGQRGVQPPVPGVRRAARGRFRPSPAVHPGASTRTATTPSTSTRSHRCNEPHHGAARTPGAREKAAAGVRRRKRSLAMSDCDHRLGGCTRCSRTIKKSKGLQR